MSHREKTHKLQRFVPSVLTTFALLAAFIPVYLLGRGVYGFGVILKTQADEARSHYYANAADQAQQTQAPVCVPGQVPFPVEGFIPSTLTLPKQNFSIKLSNVFAGYSTLPLQEDLAYVPNDHSTAMGTMSTVGIIGEDSPKGFGLIKKLAKRDKIEISSNTFTAEYEVVERNSFYSAKEDVFAVKDSPMVTLVAAKGTFAQEKYIVRATLVSIKANCYDSIQ